MIKSCNNDHLNNQNINPQYYLFFQIWKELTDFRTFDSYQFKSFNPINGIEELIHTCDLFLNGLTPTSHSIIAVSEELLKSVRNDYVLLSCYNHIRNRMLCNLGKKKDSKTKITELRYELKYYLKQLKNTYDEKLIDCLCSCIDNNDTQKLPRLVSSFISRCIDNGWSVKALHQKIRLKDSVLIRDFLTGIRRSQKQTYCVFFPFKLKITPISGKTKEESTEYVSNQLPNFNICLKSKEEIIRDYPELDNSLLSSDKYMIVVCNEMDIYSASHSAVLKLTNALNILSFFSSIDSWGVNYNWIAFNQDSPYSKSIRTSDIYYTYKYLDSASMVYSKFRSMVEHNTINKEIYQKLLSSFSYANLSSLSTSLEEKYINMWIALEALSRTDSSENIISNILTFVPNACSLRFIYKEIRNFAEECDRCGISLDFGEKNIDIHTDDKEQMVSDLIEVMRDTNHLSTLKSRCTINNLLEYRCSEIEKIINNPSEFISHITSHHKTIQWHLDRLYRIRNEIAHSGIKQNFAIIRYTEHLYDYIASCVSEVVRIANDNNSIDFGEIIAVINDNYYEFEQMSTDINKSRISAIDGFGSLWKNGIIDFFRIDI